MNIILVRIFKTKEKNAICIFNINGTRYNMEIRETESKSLSDIKSINHDYIINLLYRALSLSCPRLSGYTIELDIFPFQSISFREYKTLMSSIEVRY